MMAPKSEKFIIDFSNYIVERTDHFIGREWVFQAINDWLTDLNGSRFFLLTGEPGSGKTAIASRLVQFSYESVTPLESFVGLFPNFLSAIHFCSARDSRWINPHVFAESLAMQLMERYPDYAQALPEKSENRQIHINVQQQFGQGQATGVIINRLDTSGITPEDTFNHLIRGPLEALCRRKRNRQIIILIDALDEALVYSGNTNILSLLAHINELPPNVRFILTSRTDIRVRSAFLEAEEFSLSATEHNEYNQRDIYLYVQDQLKSDKNLVSEEPAYIAELTEVCLNKSEGNFLYIRFLLNAMSKGLRPMEDLAGLPEGLDGLYFDSLERVVKLGGRDWFNEYRSLMGVLSVTQEGLTLAQLQAFTKQSKSSVLEYRRNLQQFIEGFKVPCEKEEPEMRYRLYHQSVTEFLHQEFLTVKKSKVENSFYLPADEWHRTMADICDNDNLSIIWEDIKHKSVEQGRREYARRHFVTHLYLAREFPRLFNLLDAGEYGRAKVQHDPSTYSYAQDLVLGQQAAMWEGYSVEEGIALLPQLWRYTLLLRSLTSIAENYSLATIELLVLLNREAKAFSLIELLPKQDDKAYAMLHIARLLGMQAKRKEESLRFFLKSYELARSIRDSKVKAMVLGELGGELARIQQWERAEVAWNAAEVTIDTIKDNLQRSEVLGKLSWELANAQKWKRAEEVVLSISNDMVRAKGFKILGEELAKAQLWEQAESIANSIEDGMIRAEFLGKLSEELAKAQLWEQAESMANSIEDGMIRAEFLGKLGEELAKAQLWEQAGKLILSITNNATRAKFLGKLARELAKAGQWKQANVLWREVEMLIGAITDYRTKVRLLEALGESLAEAHQWKQAKEVASSIEQQIPTELMEELAGPYAQSIYWERSHIMMGLIAHEIEDNNAKKKISILSSLAIEMSNTHQIEESTKLWSEIKDIIKTISDSQIKAKMLSELGRKLRQAHLWERAEVLGSSIENSMLRVGELGKLGIALAQARQWKQAEAICKKLELATRIDDDSQVLIAVLRTSVGELLQMREWSGAEAVIRSIENTTLSAEMFAKLVKSLAQGRQWERAEVVAYSIKDSDTKAIVLKELTEKLIEEKKWKRADALIRTVGNTTLSTEMFTKLAKSSIQGRQWKRAEEVTYSIEDNKTKAMLLEELAGELIKEKKWKQAEEVAYSIEDSKAKAMALGELVTALAQEQMWKQAEVIVDAIKKNKVKARCLTELGRRLTQAQLGKRAGMIWDKAIETAFLIKDDKARSKALQSLAEELARAQQWDRVKEIAWAVDGNALREIILGKLGIILAQAQQWEQSKEVAYSIQDIGIQVDVLRELGLALAQTQQWSSAQEVAHSIKDEGIKKRLLLYINNAIYKSKQEQTKAITKALIQKQMWEQATEVAYSIEDGDTKAMVLGELVIALAQEQRWEQAEEVAYSIEDNDTKAMVLGELVIALAQEQRWEQAEAVVDTIEKNRVKVRILTELGRKLTQVQKWKRAEEVWDKAAETVFLIKDAEASAKAVQSLAEELVRAQQWARAEDLKKAYHAQNRKKSDRSDRAIGKCAEGAQILSGVERVETIWTLIQNQQWKQAEMMARSIENSKTMTEMLREIALELIRVQQWDRAEAVAHTIQNRGIKAKILRQLGLALAKMQMWEQAEMVWNKVELVARISEDSRTRVEMLREKMTFLSRIGKHDQVLRSIQGALIEAETREYAINLLLITTKLISLQPEIGTSLFGAVTWVDNFLVALYEVDPVHEATVALS